MTAILNSKWHGFAALIWSLCGFIVALLLPGLFGSFAVAVFLIWSLLGWIAPVLLLAISGMRRGIVAGRICGALAIICSRSADSFDADTEFEQSVTSRTPNTALEPTAAAPAFYVCLKIHACSYSRRGSALDR
jgi:hypothetical protein